MEKKASIIYVKNGIENEIILDKFDNLMLSSKLKDIFEIETIIHLTNDSVRSYEVKNDVEKVWIKNFKFTGPNKVNIKGSKNQNGRLYF